MIAWTIAQIALLGTLLALAAWGAESALRTARRPTRWPWVAALLLTLVLGALAPLQVKSAATVSPTLAVTPTAAAPQPTAAPTDVWSMLGTLWTDVSAQTETLVQRGWSAWHAGTPGSIGAWLLAAWVVVSVALLMAFATVHWRYQRRRAQWPLHTVRGTTVRVAHDTGPAVIGVTDTEIVVPAWLLERDATEQELVLAHELEHVRVHDPLLLAVAQAAVVLLPWHPAVWWMASRLRLAVELDCDARVLARGATARDYGALLIDLTDHRAGFGAALPAFSCRPSHLERRLVAMTPKRLKYPMVRALSTGALASLALLAACEAKLPTAEEVDNMTAASVTSIVAKSALMDTTAATYFVDGKQVTKAQANSIARDSIASVAVLKQPTGSAVHIVTRSGARENDLRVTPLAKSAAPAGRPDVVVNGAAFTGLLIIDGVARESTAMNELNPDQIESINVIKGAAAMTKYSDPRAANGVIEVTTKKPKP